MRIRVKKIYTVFGYQFETLDKAKRFLADRIGEVVDKNTSSCIHPGDRLAVNSAILKSAPELIDLLSAYVGEVDDDTD